MYILHALDTINICLVPTEDNDSVGCWNTPLLK